MELASLNELSGEKGVVVLLAEVAFVLSTVRV